MDAHLPEIIQALQTNSLVELDRSDHEGEDQIHQGDVKHPDLLVFQR